MSATRPDLYQSITDRIIAALDAGPAAWSCPWHRDGGGLPTNALTRKPYRGINILSLWSTKQAELFTSGRWASYRQWQALGAQVRKGAKGTPILFYKDLPRSEDADAATPRFVARASSVFNSAQVDGAPEEAPGPCLEGAGPTPDLDAFVSRTGAVIRDGDSACYMPGLDEIRMPARQRFTSSAGYAATPPADPQIDDRHCPRPARQRTTPCAARAYAAEEPAAELGAAFLLAHLGLASTPHPNHAAYIAHWLPLLRSDPRALVTAAALASRAADHLAALQPGVTAAPTATTGIINTNGDDAP